MIFNCSIDLYFRSSKFKSHHDYLQYQTKLSSQIVRRICISTHIMQEMLPLRYPV